MLAQTTLRDRFGQGGLRDTLRHLSGKHDQKSHGRPGTQEFAAALEEELGIELFMSDSPAGHVVLHKIVVPKDKRGQGVGSKAMDRITKWADEGDQVVSLTPDSAFGGSVSRLRDFYKRFGFVENKGRNKDYRISETMYRPKLSERSLDSLRHLSGKHNQKAHGRPASGWKPSMSRDEAEEWVKDSAITGDLYHQTRSGESLRQEGFLPSKTSHAGAGVYVCESERDASTWEFYAEGKAGSAPVERVTIKANVESVAEWKDAPGSPLAVSGDIDLVKRLDGGMPKPSHLSDEYVVEARAAKQWADKRGFTPALERMDALAVAGDVDVGTAQALAWQESGFDALRVSFSGSSWDSRVVSWQAASGGDQLLVFDPERVVVVNEG